MVSAMTNTNALSTPNPAFSEYREDWEKLRDAYRGERVVKQRGMKYLPATSSQLADGAGKNSESVGHKAYEAYKLRARFPNFLREAVHMAVGMAFSQPWTFKASDAIKDTLSSRGESLQELAQRVVLEQLLMGRVGLMTDLPTSAAPGKDRPYISLYQTERLINWDDGAMSEIIPNTLNLVVLKELAYVRKNFFDWKQEDIYRVLVLGDMMQNEVTGSYRVGRYEQQGFDESQLVEVNWRGRTLDYIPFTIINSCDVTPDVDDPPLLDLAETCYALYRGDADYRQNLFMQGQDTFVTIGGGFDQTDVVRVGAGAHIDLPMGGDAKYVGVSGSGLSEQRQSQENLERRAGSMGAQTLDTTSRERESGSSLKIRVAARTADMNQIVDAAAEGLRQALAAAAELTNEDPDNVEVEPNKEFGDMPLSGQDMLQIMQARNEGFPMSRRTMHSIAKARRMTSMTYEEEVEADKKEKEDDDFEVEKDTPLGNGSDGAQNQNGGRGSPEDS